MDENKANVNKFTIIIETNDFILKHFSVVYSPAGRSCFTVFKSASGNRRKRSVYDYTSVFVFCVMCVYVYVLHLVQIA